jgi:hypothetical protein
MNNQTFKQKMIDVINMNDLFRTNVFQNKQLIKSQKQFVIDEANETLAALNSFDTREFVDGIGDVFVTASYLAYITHNNQSSFDIHYNAHHPVTLNIKSTESTLKNISNYSGIDMLNILHGFMNLMEKHFDIIDVLDRIHVSNMSKFPLASESTPDVINKNIEYIKAKKNLHNVGYIEKNGRIIYLDLDTQKFQKPMSFVEPELQAYENNPKILKLMREIKLSSV